MGIETGAYNEQEKKKKKIDEKELKEQQKKIIDQQKTKEYIKTEIDTEDQLHSLHELVDKGILSQEHVEQIIAGEDLDEDTIKDIFDKIDQMEELKDVDKYLPSDLRITKDDYHTALHDDIFRTKTITKLDTALTLLSQQINPDTAGGINLFSGFLTVLDKNLVTVQENTIDIKDSLVEIEDKKYPKPKISFLEKIIIFLKNALK
ncbi:hypothetical protein A9Q91_03295 [Candidatus Gracilibacteria bacterium 28_42_T64]|nr:hypothetical protein A9Q91_03295 [Candidatus Gracilibacteria bacterium 28_42_T64]